VIEKCKKNLRVTLKETNNHFGFFGHFHVAFILTRAMLCIAWLLLLLCVCPSHAGIVSKRIKISSNFFLALLAPLLWFSNTTCGYEILTGSGACHLGGLRSVWKHLTVAVREWVADTFISVCRINLFFCHCISILLENQHYTSNSLSPF